MRLLNFYMKLYKQLYKSVIPKLYIRYKTSIATYEAALLKNIVTYILSIIPKEFYILRLYKILLHILSLLLF